MKSLTVCTLYFAALLTAAIAVSGCASKQSETSKSASAVAQASTQPSYMYVPF